jgi:hypothetical protein
MIVNKVKARQFRKRNIKGILAMASIVGTAAEMFISQNATGGD